MWLVENFKLHSSPYPEDSDLVSVVPSEVGACWIQLKYSPIFSVPVDRAAELIDLPAHRPGP